MQQALTVKLLVRGPDDKWRNRDADYYEQHLTHNYAVSANHHWTEIV